MRIGIIDAPKLRDSRNVNITDHKLVYCHVKCKKDKKEPQLISYRDFSKFDSEKVIRQIAEIDWDSVTRMQDVDEMEKFITSNITKVYDENAPLVQKRVTRRKAPWMNGEIKRITRMKNKLRNKYWRTRERSDWEAYKDIRNGLNSIVWKAKKSYFAEELSLSKSPKEFWRNLKQNGIVNGKDNRSLPAEMKADEVNKYFSEMGQECDIDEDLLKFYKENRKDELEPAFSFMPVTEDDVKSAMNEIKSHAVGYDNVSMTMIKSVSPFAIGAITHLINKSLMSGKFPQRWKTSIVHPLPKVTTPTSYNQLRPISILPAMSKIIEKIVVRQIVNFTNERGLLPKMQSGFRKDYSTCTALTNLFAELFDARDEGLYSIIVMLDFKQAFDSVSPELLVAMLHYLGFDEGATDWIESYSCERVQVTKIGSETSRPLVKRRGVAQGSGVGPILFIIYTIALYICVRYSKVHGYVDDCQMHKPYKPGQMAAAVAEVNSDLHSVSEWSEKHGLKLNINKCTVMHIAPRESVQALSDDGVCVTLGGQSLAISAKIKTLGVELDSSLSLSDHVTHNIQKAFGRLRGMYRFKDLLPAPTKLRIIQTIVLPVFLLLLSCIRKQYLQGGQGQDSKVAELRRSICIRPEAARPCNPL